MPDHAHTVEDGPSISAFRGEGARLISLGSALWLVGAGSLHLMAAWSLLRPGYSMLILLAYLPTIWGCLRLVGRLKGRMTLLPATALTCAPALVLDGLVLTFWPATYGQEALAQRIAAAGLLWFCGVALAWAFGWEQART